MSAFFELVTIPATFAAKTAPNVDLGFEPSEWNLENTGSTIVDYSFDGENVHGQIGAFVATNSLARNSLKTKAKKLWLKDGAGSSQKIRVQAITL